MKKNYIIPETMFEDTLNIHSYMQTASDPHINDEGNVEIPGEGGGGNADDGCTKQRNAWEEGGLWTLLLAFLLTMAGSMNLRAQSVTEPDATRTLTGISINLLNSTSVSYNANIDSVRNLPGIGLKIYLSTTADNKSIDYLYSQMAAITYTYSGSVTPVGNNVNANWNITGYNIPETEPSISASISSYKYASRLEYPHINTDGNSQVVVRYIDSTYGISYSVEWDNSLIANRWTCYTMNATNGENNVDRSDAFKEDPLLPSATRSTLDDYSGSGYSRGHLCPAADRKCTTTAVKETCFLSNMQPQWQSHNGGVWATLEEKIRTWNSNTYREGDLYVVKGATISNVSTTSSFNPSTGTSGVFPTKCNGRLPVPRYFFMAVLAKKSGTWHAMGIWSPHTETTNNLTEYITIDELEARTGIDFFCNLVDVEEADVEARIEKSFWGVSSNAKERPDDDFFVPEEEELDGEEELEIALW